MFIFEISVCFKNERALILQKPFLHGLSPAMISSAGPFGSRRLYVSHANQPVTRATVQPSWVLLLQGEQRKTFSFTAPLGKSSQGVEPEATKLLLFLWPTPDQTMKRTG